MKKTAVLLLLLTLACARAVDRAEWQRMPPENRVLFVQGLIAEEQSKDAKGGKGRRVTRTAAEYARAIDDAYARGEQQQPREVFEELTR